MFENFQRDAALRRVNVRLFKCTHSSTIVTVFPAILMLFVVVE